MESTQGSHIQRQDKKRTIMVIGITILLFFLIPAARSITLALPAVVLLIDRRRTDKSWAEIGLKSQGIWGDIREAKNWIFLVAFVSPILTIILAQYLVPDFVSHLVGRLPVDIQQLVPTFFVLLIGTFLEELIFRGYIQTRLSAFGSRRFALLLTSILFAGMHVSQGAASVVTYDLFWIFVDSLIYGLIFLKTRNLFVSWIAHFVSDVVGIAAILIWLV